MAFVSHGREYTSPAKRIKLDESNSETDGNTSIEFQSIPTSGKLIKEPSEGSFVINSEATNSDSGFNERNSTPGDSENSEPGLSLLDMSSQSSQKSEERTGENNDDENDDKDEVSSTVSNLSDLSGLSEISGQDWKPMAGPMNWVQKQMLTGANPRILLQELFVDGQVLIPETINDLTLWKIIFNMLSEPPRRQKLRHINTLSDVIGLLKSSKKIIVLTGAGVSVSCGIPDFRSRDGIYSRLAIDFPDLPDPQAMFDIQYFSQDPRPFFKFAREIYPGQFKPSPCHRFIKILENHNKLLRNYSQNIDTLEQVSGIKNVIECHGSFATASCTKCKHKVDADDIREDVFAQRIPLCTKCNENQLEGDDANNYKGKGIMKPDIVFFGEGLPEIFHSSMAKDKDECDLLIVIGSSLKVRPVALIPNSIPAHVPQILINREPLPHFNFDIELLGDSDVIINQICHIMGEGWNEICWIPSPLTECKQLLPPSNSKYNHCISNKWKNVENLVPTTVEISEGDSLHMSVDSADSNPSGVGCIISKERHSEATKERHMSVDSSTRDSGLGFLADSPASGLEELSHSQIPSVSDPQPSTSRMEESSHDSRLNIPVSNTNHNTADTTSRSRQMSIDEGESFSKGIDSEDNDEELEMRASWVNRSKESLSARLPENAYFYMPNSRYIFPGAEVYSDDEKLIERCYSVGGTSTSSGEGSEEPEDPSTRSSIGESDPEEDGSSKMPSRISLESNQLSAEDSSFWQEMIERVFQKSS